MNSKHLIMLCMTVGGALGGMVPELWGAGAFSFSSVFTGFIGGIAGIWVGYKMTR